MPQDTAALPDFRSSLCRHGTSRVYRRPKEKTTPSRGMVSERRALEQARIEQKSKKSRLGKK
jgi:hypothetical protein